MPTILSAKESRVLVAGPDGGAGEPVEGLQAITYKVDRGRQDVPAIGTDERIAVDFGLMKVVGALTTAPASRSSRTCARAT